MEALLLPFDTKMFSAAILVLRLDVI